MTSDTTNKRGWISGLSVLVIIATLTGCAIQVRPVAQPSATDAPTHVPSATTFISPTVTPANAAATTSAQVIPLSVSLQRQHTSAVRGQRDSEGSLISATPQPSYWCSSAAQIAVTSQQSDGVLLVIPTGSHELV